ncbi:MAG: type I-E CRISPR-associated protein Cse1/CasA [Rhodospirillales bacterium]|nr:type I-E CRISPR-associated protein Cse1/CasA [Rhodospirillales bacterium]
MTVREREGRRSSLNLVSDPWIPVWRDGMQAVIRPSEIADPGVSRLNWPRDDLNIAGIELLIGLVFLADPPRDDADWHARYDAPDPDRLRFALEPFAQHFELAGEGPRFLQDLEPFETAAKTRNVRRPDMLFLDSAGENAAKHNADLMVRRSRYPSLPLPLAAMALYALQAFAPAGGAGNRTSMRGGGPMVTLVRPHDDGHALWRRIWANVPQGQPLSPDQAKRALPWLRPTRTSERQQIVTPEMSHPAEAFFGMPRRLRLVFGECSVTGVAQQPYGTNYSGWIHPLSPYYRPKPEKEWLPCHPKPGRTSYRNWLGLTFGEGSETRRIAGTIDRFQKLTNAPRWEVEAGGWAMDNMKPLDFALHVYPVFHLDVDAQVRVENLVKAANVAAKALSRALRRAVTLEGRAAELIREALFADTEPAFVRAVRTVVRGDDEAVEEAWLAALRKVAISVFDRHAVPALPDRDVANVEQAVAARRALLGAFMRPNGVRQTLELPDQPPEPRS